MTWCNRYNTFIVIASIYIISSIIYLTFESLEYVEYDESIINPERRKLLKSESLKSIITCSVVVVISALFIVAIVKRYRYLIIPWLLLAIYLFYAFIAANYWWFKGLRWPPSIVFIFIYLSFILFACVIQIFIFSFSWFLYNQIYEEHKLAKSQMTQCSDASKSFV